MYLLKNFQLLHIIRIIPNVFPNTSFTEVVIRDEANVFSCKNQGCWTYIYFKFCCKNL